MDIKKLLKSGESETVEFKTAFGKEVIISLVAFANTGGGKVVVGVDNSGRLTGVDIGTETEHRYLNEIKVSTYPQIIPHTRLLKLNHEIHEQEQKESKPSKTKTKIQQAAGETKQLNLF